MNRDCGSEMMMFGKPKPVSRIMFDKYDSDKSGSITKDEFKLLVEELGYRLSEDELSIAVQKLDTDGDNSISFDEFKAWWSTDKRFEKLQLGEEELKQLKQWQKFFNHYDSDKV